MSFNIDVDSIAEKLQIDPNKEIKITDEDVKTKKEEVKEEKKDDKEEKEVNNNEDDNNSDSDNENEEGDDDKEEKKDTATMRIEELEKELREAKKQNLELKKSKVSPEDRQKEYDKLIAEGDYETLVKEIRKEMLETADTVSLEEELEDLKLTKIIDDGFDILKGKGAKITNEFKTQIAEIIEEFDLKIEEASDFEKAYKIWIKDNKTDGEDTDTDKKKDKISKANTLEGKAKGKSVSSSSRGKVELRGNEDWDTIREKLMQAYE